MRVKVGNDWFSSDSNPLCVQMTGEELGLIKDMDLSSSPEGKFAVYPEDWTPEDIKEWMKG